MIDLIFCIEAVKALIDGIGPLMGGLADTFAKAVDAIFGILPNCDGPVAVQRLSFTPDQIRSLYHGVSALKNTTHYLGTDSPAGCGTNSIYGVSWVLERLDVPNYTTVAPAQTTSHAPSTALAPVAISNTTTASVQSTSTPSSAMNQSISTNGSSTWAQTLTASTPLEKIQPTTTPPAKSAGSAPTTYFRTFGLLLILAGLVVLVFA